MNSNSLLLAVYGNFPYALFCDISSRNLIRVKVVYHTATCEYLQGSIRTCSSHCNSGLSAYAHAHSLVLAASSAGPSVQGTIRSVRDIGP